VADQIAVGQVRESRRGMQALDYTTVPPDTLLTVTEVGPVGVTLRAPDGRQVFDTVRVVRNRTRLKEPVRAPEG
jgi:hypothetical protein